MSLIQEVGQASKNVSKKPWFWVAGGGVALVALTLALARRGQVQPEIMPSYGEPAQPTPAPGGGSPDISSLFGAMSDTMQAMQQAQAESQHAFLQGLTETLAAQGQAMAEYQQQMAEQQQALLSSFEQQQQAQAKSQQDMLQKLTETLSAKVSQNTPVTYTQTPIINDTILGYRSTPSGPAPVREKTVQTSSGPITVRGTSVADMPGASIDEKWTNWDKMVSADVAKTSNPDAAYIERTFPGGLSAYVADLDRRAAAGTEPNIKERVAAEKKRIGVL